MKSTISNHFRIGWALRAAVAVSLCASGTSAELALEKELATDAGWRAARWKMSVAEVAQALGKDFQEQKRSKRAERFPVAVRGKLKNKIPMDGLEFEVKFGFNKADRLNAVMLVCEKAKKESFAAIEDRFKERFGETHSEERSYGRVGIAIHPDIQEIRNWRSEARRIEFHTLEIRPNIFMWVRRLSVIVRMPESEEEFGDKGMYRFSGEVQQILAGKPPRWCRLEVVPSKASLKASCGKDGVILDHILTDSDRLDVGERSSLGELNLEELTVVTKDRSGPVKFVVGTDVITLLKKSFPKLVSP